MPNLTNPLKNEILKRGLRTFHLRNFDTNARSPKMSGRIVCHIVDFRRDATLANQLDYLVERDVRTFRIYTDRAADIANLLSSHRQFQRLASKIIAVTAEKEKNRVWKLVDNYNFGYRGDRWSLALQAGELLLYPHFETRTLPDLCQFLYDEGRKSLFAISLDLYPAEPSSAATFAYGKGGWVFDRYGYSFEYEPALKFDSWQGGFLFRYPQLTRAFGRPHLSRTPLLRTGFRSLHTRDLRLGLPRIQNLANSLHHLSPTGCIVSDQAYRFFQSRLADGDLAPAVEKLLSAKTMEMNWRHDDLVRAGFMNAGQWL